MSRGIKKGTMLGKCQWCSQPLREGDGNFTSFWAKIINTKWYCGECLAALKPVVDELATEKEYYDDKRESEQMGDINFLKQKWVVEVGTGKIRRNKNFIRRNKTKL